MLTSAPCSTCAVYAQHTQLLKVIVKRNRTVAIEATQCLMELGRKSKACNGQCAIDIDLYEKTSRLIHDHLDSPDQMTTNALTYALYSDASLSRLHMDSTIIVQGLAQMGLSALRTPQSADFPAALDRYLSMLLERGLANTFNETLNYLRKALR